MPTLRRLLDRLLLRRTVRPCERPRPFALSFDRLEDRLTPDSKPRLISPLVDGGTFSQTEILAQVRSPVPLQDLANITEYLGLQQSIDLSRSRVEFTAGSTTLISIGLFAQVNPHAVITSLSSISTFDWVRPNYVYAPAFPGAAGWLDRIPNDPRYSDQWHLPLVNAPAAWDTTFGSPSVIVSVFDDGIDLVHPDLAGNIFRNPNEIAGDGIDNDGNGYIDDISGYDFSRNTPNTNPDDPTADSHGTQVAGLLAATIDNAVGVSGLAGRVKILPIKLVGAGPLTSLSLARATAYAVQMGSRIFSCSINLDPFVGDPTVESAARFAYDRGVLWFNSAGNLNAAEPPRTQFEEILFVAATDRTDRKASYSNYGRGIDVSAPGGDLTDGLLTTTTVAAGSYTTATGTSMATPLAAAVAALVWSAHPNYTRDQVASRVIATADNIDLLNPSFIDMLGSGRINAGLAVGTTPTIARLGPVTGLPIPGVPICGLLGAFTVRVEAPLDPATVIPSSFELRGAGPDNLFQTGDDLLLPFEINHGNPYLIGTNDLHFTSSANLTYGLYRFTAKSSQLRDPFGRPIDGTGLGGGDLVHTFGVAVGGSGILYEDVNLLGLYDPILPPRIDRDVFVDLNNNGVWGQIDAASPKDFRLIPENPSTAINSEITIAGLNGPVQWATVTVQFRHPQPGDLKITLVTPSGHRLILFQNQFISPKSTDDLVSLTFRDDACGFNLDQGIIRPYELLSGLTGETGNGIWSLEIIDTTTGDIGRFIEWSLTVADEPTTSTDRNGFFTFGDVQNGTYAIRTIPQPGWITTAPVMASFGDPDNPPQVTLGEVRQQSIMGQVTNPQGQPLQSVTVYIDANGNDRFDPQEPNTQTGTTGFFSLGGLELGSYSLRIQPPLGMAPSAPVSGERTVTLTLTAPQNGGNGFVLAPLPGSASPQITAINPSPRNSPVRFFEVQFDRPVSGMSSTQFSLLRNGEPVALTGTTLIGSGGSYQLLGTSAATAEEGNYILVALAPPDGSSIPPRTDSETWTVDLTPPLVTAISLDQLPNGGPVRSASVQFSENVTTAISANVNLLRNGTVISTQGMELTGAGATLSLTKLLTLTSLPGDYLLRIVPLAGTLLDQAGNGLGAAFERAFTVTTPAPIEERLVFASDAGVSTTVVVTNPFGTLLFSLTPFESNFTGGARVTTADVNADGVADIVVGSGPGRAPQVLTFDGKTGASIGQFLGFEASFTGGLFVTHSDFDRDGVPEIIVSPDQGGGPRVRVFRTDGQSTLADFFAIGDPNFRGGARAAVGDLNADGTVDLLVSAGFGGGPRMAGYNGVAIAGGLIPGTLPPKLFNDFFAFEPSLRNGVYLTSLDINADGFADLVTGGGPGGGPRVQIFDGKALTENRLTVLANFFAGPVNDRSGVRLLAKDLAGTGIPDLFTATKSPVRMYSGETLLANPGNPVPDELRDAFGMPGPIFVG